MERVRREREKGEWEERGIMERVWREEKEIK